MYFRIWFLKNFFYPWSLINIIISIIWFPSYTEVYMYVLERGGICWFVCQGKWDWIYYSSQGNQVDSQTWFDATLV